MKPLSKAAIAAKAMREDLKKVFPIIKFKVISQTFADGNGIRVSWENGPSVPSVESVILKYQYGHFNYSKNVYKLSNIIKNIPQVKHVSTSRSMSRNVEDSILEMLHQKFPKDCGGMNKYGYVKRFNASVLEMIWREFYDMDLFD